MTSDYQTIDTVARTAWGEARGCGINGMHAVISVIVNRAKHPSWWGHDLSSVCLRPWQFSCRNENDPNRKKLLAVTTKDPEFHTAIYLATRAAAGTLPDITNGADSYYALGMRNPPAWAAQAVHTYSDAWHGFYKTQDPATGLSDSPNFSIHSVTTDELNSASLAGDAIPGA